MKTVLLVLVLFMVGCGKTFRVDSDFLPIVDEFNAQSEVKSAPKAENIVIEYGDTSNKNAGATCYKDFPSTPRIAVDRHTWKVMSASSQREMLRHEIGHCVLNREHTKEKMEDGCSVSIMAPSPVGDWCQNAHGKEYDEELFN